MNLKIQITNIFVQIDDFSKEFDVQIKKLKLDALGDSNYHNYDRFSFGSSQNVQALLQRNGLWILERFVFKQAFLQQVYRTSTKMFCSFRFVFEGKMPGKMYRNQLYGQYNFESLQKPKNT